MSLRDILDDRLIAIDLDADDKDQAIAMLAQRLKDAHYIADVASFKKDIYYRESQGLTGIGHYLAIPHGQSSSVIKNGIAIGKLKKQIDWETLDGKGVRVVCLFAVSKDHDYANNQLKLLAELAGKLGNDSAINQLINAESVEDIKAVFCGDC